MIKEVWKDIKNYEGLYQISNMGNVKRLGIKNQFGFFPSEKEIVKKKSRNGYLRVILSKNSKPKDYYIHRLVAEHFIENPEQKQQVNHKNGIKQDNNVNNLEWATPKENMRHAVAQGLWKDSGILKKYCFIGANAAKIVTQKKVGMYNLNEELLEVFDGVRDVERKYGFLHSGISLACNGKIKTSYGYIWKYIEDVNCNER